MRGGGDVVPVDSHGLAQLLCQENQEARSKKKEARDDSYVPGMLRHVTCRLLIGTVPYDR